jgi:hypothetical protein
MPRKRRPPEDLDGLFDQDPRDDTAARRIAELEDEIRRRTEHEGEVENQLLGAQQTIAEQQSQLAEMAEHIISSKSPAKPIDENAITIGELLVILATGGISFIAGLVAAAPRGIEILHDPVFYVIAALEVAEFAFGMYLIDEELTKFKANLGGE